MFRETGPPRRASLERTLKPRFLSRVFSSRLRAGVQAGVIAAAATGGAIIGFGVRHNDWSGPFATLGYQVMRGAGVATAPRVLHATAGIVAHVAWMVIWGIAFAAVSYRKTPAVSMVFALLVGFVGSCHGASQERPGSNPRRPQATPRRQRVA